MSPARRRSMHRLVAGFALAALLGTPAVVSSCRPTPPPIREGTVEFWAGDEPASFDPFSTDRPSQLAVMHLAYSGLVKRDASGNLLPDLALEVPTLENGGVLSGGRRLRYRLRKGVRFSDGRLLGAADAVATWRIAKARAAQWGAPPRWVAIVAGVEAPTDEQVIVTLDRPVAWAVEEVLPFVLPAHGLKGDPHNLALFEQPDGTGPYRLAQWLHGSSMTFEADPAYHGGAPRVARLEVRFSIEASKAGEFAASDAPTVWEWVGGQDVDRVARARPGSVRRAWADFWWGYAFNLRRPLFQDVRVRRALAAAYPRRTIDGSYLRPLPAGVVSRPLRPDSWAYAARLAGPAESTRTAAAALRLAGWRMGSDGILGRGEEKLTVGIGSALRTPYEVSELLQDAYDETRETWMPLGVWPSTAISDQRFYDSYDLGGTLATGRFDIAYAAFSAGIDPTKDWPFRADDVPSPADPVGRNAAAVRDSAMERLLARAELPAARDVRATRIRRLLDHLERQAYVIVERPGEKVTAVHRVKNVRPSDGQWGDLWNVHEWEIEPAAGP